MPQIRIRDGGGTLRTITRIKMRDGEGLLRTIQRIRIRDASNVLRTVYQSISVTLSDATKNATGSTFTITTGSVTASVSGGTAPYSYSWVELFGGGIDIVSPTSATSTFRATGMTSGEVRSAAFNCVVTDATGAVATSGDLSVTIDRT